MSSFNSRLENCVTRLEAVNYVKFPLDTLVNIALACNGHLRRAQHTLLHAQLQQVETEEERNFLKTKIRKVLGVSHFNVEIV